jgi:hypothetical protein
MAEYYNIQLTTEEMAPIERAHLHRGFTSTKTPLKWIKFFRLCVIQREVQLKKKNKKLWTIWISFFVVSAILLFATKYGIFINFILFIIAIIFAVKTGNEFRKNYTDGYDFFSDYFSALFTLIEEELPQLGTIRLTANVRETIDTPNLTSTQDTTTETRGFISGREEFYEKEISNGSCKLKDGTEVDFSFVEKVRKRIITKRGISGKRKTKHKYKSVYPFILKMSVPKSIYQLKPDVDKSDIQIEEDDSFYYLKARRKFDVTDNDQNNHSPYVYEGAPLISVEFFSLEIVNLFNISYGCFTLKQ